jgi:hypothetical protein
MTYEADPIRADARRARQRRRLGPDAACILCGVPDPEQLTTMRRTLLEEHHLAGRANDEQATVVVCLNHHAVLSNGQRDAGVFDPTIGPGLFDADTAGSLLGRVVNALRSLAVFTHQLTGLFGRLADLLEHLGERLDDTCSGWRATKLLGAAT